MSSRFVRRAAWLAAIVAFSSAGVAGAVGDEIARSSGAPPEAWDFLCDEAVGDRPDRAVAILRAAGESGWRAFSRRHRSTIDGLAERPACLCDPDTHERRVATAFDKISAQRDAASSGLYWYTDLAEAIAAARQGPKPILSLRLLGRLDDDLSCANSRFFRTTLYADAELAAYLREHFILHWETVRPVPIITIDFGDGRTMRRTITGNSAHYVLDPQGRVVDCLPGLYAPAEFRRRLEDAEGLARVSFPPGDESYRRDRLVQYHETAIRRIDDSVRAASLPAATETVSSAAPPMDIPIGVANPFGGTPSLPTALGETLLAPRRIPEPFAPWTVGSGALDAAAPPALTVNPVLATAASPPPTFPADRFPRRTTVRPAAPRPTAREAAVTVNTKTRVEERMIEAVLPSAPVQTEPDRTSVAALDRPDSGFVATAGVSSAAAPDPPAAALSIDTAAIVRNALATAFPPLDAATPGWPFDAARGAVSVYREPGRPITKTRVEQSLENAVLNVAANPPLENSAWPFDAASGAVSIYREPAITKIRVEQPLTDVFRGEVARAEPPAAPVATGDVLGRLAEQIRGDVRLAPGSLKLIRAKFDSMPADPVEGSPTWRFQRFDRMLEALRTSIAGDTARNEFDLHRRIHAWLAENPGLGVNELNERVYAELFLTPRSDPWLGLAPADAFPALDQGGLFVAP